MIEIILKSNITERVIKSTYTGQQLLEMNEEEIVDEMTKCDCKPIGETNTVECNCYEEWQDYTLIVGNENNYNNIED
ncbi:hypothetical protein [Clostridium botulinum]|uniref:Uncharacterized protein n=1 Tax=Clostridium botulinum CFSAN001627 TaxID=1232189 RepID=M1ZP69_CLOBO|nr:hypothetical protein [Clostridium botulinum]EKN40692.1 hypothetical protein CFSAN001627_17878 [Clostridium botulinum CFSAN001627]MBY6889393.1 acetyltransferase [Clostridium botulinum]MBY6908913.1 acetyltransferase [Clostridium botulinum]MBY6923574.1 acetyltransferase [Clostridium botulinum]HBJ2601415.1 acetyltransferase [Clostridium botulinum]